jgi:amino acid adenylation domain-containing protein
VYCDYAILVECWPNEHGVDVLISVESNTVDALHIGQRVAATFEHMLRQIQAKENMAKFLSKLDMLSSMDIWELQKWNPPTLGPKEMLVHDLIAFGQNADRTAIFAWDGMITYGQLDTLSSQLAKQLVENYGVGPEVIVPLCFEKSMWTSVAIIGVMKAGGASVLLDSLSQPTERLRRIVSEVDPLVIISSKANVAVSKKLHTCDVMVAETFLQGTTLNVDAKASTSKPSRAEKPLPTISPSNAVYVVFTSGTTGVPKGVVVEHRNVASAIVHGRSKLLFTQTDRVFDFASYTFDTAWSNLFNTLSVGACLCVPSEADRKSNLTQTIVSMRATYLEITLSVAKLLIPSELPTLRVLNLGGERLHAEEFRHWLPHVRLLNTYGPAECTVTATCAEIRSWSAEGAGIGRPIAGTSWVVDEFSRLCPIGAVGELWIEGPLVSRGYLNDSKGTAAVFVDGPPWLSQGYHGSEKRHSHRRAYRTGDFVRYSADGSLDFVGRRDGQVKIRGQRVELIEIENFVSSAVRTIVTSQLEQGLLQEFVETSVQVAVDAVMPKASERNILVAFICLRRTVAESPEDCIEDLWHVIREVDSLLQRQIPDYMVPSGYVPMLEMPTTTSGKIDSRQLRNIASSLTREQLIVGAKWNRERQVPPSETERILISLWATIFKKDERDFDVDDDFFQAGGDSIDAMRLVGMARKQGLLLTVSNIFQNSRISGLAKVVTTKMDKELETPIAPFSLLRILQDRRTATQEVATMCGVNAEDIEDVFPCTPLQEGLIAMSMRREGDYINRILLELRSDADIERFQRAWDTLVASTPILRTRILRLIGEGLVQAIVRGARGLWETYKDINDYDRDANLYEGAILGVPLSRHALVKQSGGKTIFALNIHHAVYDGISLPKMLEAVERVYFGHAYLANSPFNVFVQHVLSLDRVQAEQFWQDQCKGIGSTVQFPPIPCDPYDPLIDRQILTVCSPGRRRGRRGTDFTTTIAIRTALALSIASSTHLNEALFGTVVSGRQAAVPGIMDIVGPTFATVPIRIMFDSQVSMDTLLRQVQEQAVAMIPFEQTGLQYIRHLNNDTKRACGFQILLVVQPPEHDSGEESKLFGKRVTSLADNIDKEPELKHFGSYALIIECQPQARVGSLQLRVSFDSAVVNEVDVEELVRLFQHALRDIYNGEPSKTVAELREELRQS